jgi:hypothetical protein
VTITRNVIFDVLPTYFAGEASEDTRTLVEEFFRSDPEFAKMAKRFNAVFNERAGASDAARERVTFERMRALLKRRNQAFGGAIAYGLAALVTLFLANPLKPPMPMALVIATQVFVGVHVICWVVWFVAARSLQAVKQPTLPS